MTTKQKTDQAAPKGVALSGLKISSVGRHGFRRLNRHWPKEGAVVARAEFTEDELRLLDDEPNLVMADAEIEVQEGSGVDELKAFAEARGIDLGKATKPEEIVDVLENPRPAPKAGSEAAANQE